MLRSQRKSLVQPKQAADGIYVDVNVNADVPVIRQEGPPIPPVPTAFPWWIVIGLLVLASLGKKQ